jgi:hypothetical protein
MDAFLYYVQVHVREPQAHKNADPKIGTFELPSRSHDLGTLCHCTIPSRFIATARASVRSRMRSRCFSFTT